MFYLFFRPSLKREGSKQCAGLNEEKASFLLRSKLTFIINAFKPSIYEYDLCDAFLDLKILETNYSEIVENQSFIQSPISMGLHGQ